MRKIFIICILAMMTIVTNAQGYIGFRDNRYVYGGYQFKFGMYVDVEHSVYSDHFGYQKGRLYVGYEQEWKYADLNAKIYGSSLWNGNYQDAGLLLQVLAKPFKNWTVDATLNPHYDTGIGDYINYSVGTGIMVNKDITLLAHYTIIPEYRDSEKRVRVGIIFKVGNLEVKPELSVPVEGKARNMRVLFSMRYTFMT